MKIVLYGTCSFPYFFRELLHVAAQKNTRIDWRALVLSWRHLELYKGILPTENLFYIHPEINRLMEEKFSDLSILSKYPGSIFRDIGADKNMPGQLRRRAKEYQVQSALAYYRCYKAYLLREKPDVVFLPVVETHDGLILYKVAKELGIRTVSHCKARNLDLSFFSNTPYDDMPRKVLSEAIPTEIRNRAERYLEDFNAKPNAAVSFRYIPKESEIVAYGRPVPIYKKFFKFPATITNLIKDQYLEPHAGRANPFWYQPHIQLWALNNIIWKCKAVFQRHYFDLKSPDQLPPRFIYFPLHMSPELSLTTLAPFFEDQFRAIDLILLNMPSDCTLVVKEHPMMRGIRSASFYRTLRKKAGVALVDYDIPGIELIKRSILTVAITGTSAMEALFLGKPTLIFGNSFFSPWLERLDSYLRLDQDIRNVMNQSRDDMRNKAIDLIARMYMVGSDCVLYDPHDVSFDWKYTMNNRNINQFFEAFMEFLNGDRSHETSTFSS